MFYLFPLSLTTFVGLFFYSVQKIEHLNDISAAKLSFNHPVWAPINNGSSQFSATSYPVALFALGLLSLRMFPFFFSGICNGLVDISFFPRYV